MKILVTGANGSLGREVVKQLSSKSAVKAGVRNEQHFSNMDNVTYVLFDYDKPETYSNALEGVDKVFIQAPPLDATALERMTPFIDFLKENKINRVVFNSAFGVDHNENAPLRKLERKFMNDNFDYTFIRPNFFIENFTTGFAAASLENENVIVANAGEGKVSFVSTKDIASVIVATLLDDNHQGKEYNLTGKEALSHSEVAAFFSEKTGRSINYVSISSEEMKAGAMQNGLPESVADYLVMLYDVAKAGHAAVITDDIKNVTGKEAVGFAEVV